MEYIQFQPLSFPIAADVAADLGNPGTPRDGYIRAVVMYTYYDAECADDEHTLDGPVIVPCGPDVREWIPVVTDGKAVVRYNIAYWPVESLKSLPEYMG